jgi:hypothetical protein
LGLPAVRVKSSCGTAKKVAASPPVALLQSMQWQSATKFGSVPNSNFTVPQAHCPVYFLLMRQNLPRSAKADPFAVNPVDPSDQPS